MCWCCDDTNWWCVLWESQADCYLTCALLCDHPCWAWALAFHFSETVLTILRRHWYFWSFLHLDLVILLFIVYGNWSILTLSWLDLILSWCSNILYCHMRPANICQTEAGQATTGWIWMRSKNGNYRNVILNISVSHNLFVSNRMPFGDCLKTWEEEYGTSRFTFAHTE